MTRWLITSMSAAQSNPTSTRRVPDRSTRRRPGHAAPFSVRLLRAASRHRRGRGRRSRRFHPTRHATGRGSTRSAIPTATSSPWIPGFGGTSCSTRRSRGYTSGHCGPRGQRGTGLDAIWSGATSRTTCSTGGSRTTDASPCFATRQAIAMATRSITRGVRSRASTAGDGSCATNRTVTSPSSRTGTTVSG